MLLRKAKCQPKMLSFLRGEVGMRFGTMLERLVQSVFLAAVGLRVLLNSQSKN